MTEKVKHVAVVKHVVEVACGLADDGSSVENKQR